MKKILLLATFFLTSCVNYYPTEEGYQHILDSWINSSKKDLVLKWGIPSETYKIDANTELLKYSESTIHGYNGDVWTSHCDTTFTIEKGKITNWKYEGNSCKAVLKELPQDREEQKGLFQRMFDWHT